MSEPLWRRAFAEGLGSMLLFATVVGSGVMAERISGGNDGVALLGNAVATGAMLLVLITILAPISGAHMNPAVSLVAAILGHLKRTDAAVYVVAQVVFGVIGVWLAHLMFDLPILEISGQARTGMGQWISEGVATFGLVLTILGASKHRPAWIAAAVALYIVAAYWFTASTSFANPAITLARSLSDSFAGIRPADVPMFIVSQLAGAGLGVLASKVLFAPGR